MTVRRFYIAAAALLASACGPSIHEFSIGKERLLVQDAQTQRKSIEGDLAAMREGNERAVRDVAATQGILETAPSCRLACGQTYTEKARTKK